MHNNKVNMISKNWGEQHKEGFGVSLLNLLPSIFLQFLWCLLFFLSFLKRDNPRS